jgi:hypothetical protein
MGETGQKATRSEGRLEHRSTHLHDEAFSIPGKPFLLDRRSHVPGYSLCCLCRSGLYGTSPVPNDGTKGRYFAGDRFGVRDLLAAGHFHRGGNLMIYDEKEVISSYMRC